MAGRPKQYTAELVAECWHYLDNFKREFKHEIPSVVGLARVTGVPRNTFYFWITKAEKEERQDDELLQEMAEVLNAINEQQELVLINGGLNSKFNANIAKLVLTKHGYHDKQDSTLSGPTGGPVKTQFIFNPVGPDDEDD